MGRYGLWAWRCFRACQHLLFPTRRLHRIKQLGRLNIRSAAQKGRSCCPIYRSLHSLDRPTMQEIRGRKGFRGVPPYAAVPAAYIQNPSVSS